jgi:PAS domain S-box-containing protein
MPDAGDPESRKNNQAPALPALTDLSPAIRAALLDPVLWRQILESYAQAVHLAVALTDMHGHPLGTCINPQPLWSLVRAQNPATPEECPFCLLPVTPCTGVAEALRKREVVTTHDRLGLTHFAVPLVLGDQPLGALIAGQVFDQYPTGRQLELEQIAKKFALPPDIISQTVRRQHPISRNVLRTYGDLLATVGNNFLHTRYHTLREADRLAEMRRVHQRLQESEARFRQLADAMPQIVWAARPDGTVDYYNQRWYEFTGFPEGSGGEEGWMSLLHTEDVQLGLARWQEARESGAMYQVESRFRDRSKEGYRWYLNRALPVRDAAGNIVRWFGTCTDIDDQKRTEVELTRSNAELQQFAYVASHDLQEPLRMVTSYMQLLAQRLHGQLDADAQEFMGYAVDGAQRMKVLIDDLLTYSRVGTQSAPLTPTDSNTVLQQTLHVLDIRIAESGATVTSDPLPIVRADRVQLGMLWQNLLSNAMKFHGPEPPRIHVSARRQGAEWVFAVRDNGIGLAPQHAERIFAMFQRLHTRREYPGTGIGLAICKKIVERHGGRIWVESVPGQGATFLFTLPAGAA